MSGLDYIKKLKESRNKAITITIEESIIDQVENIAQTIGISRNQIISESLRKFINDYEKVQNPNYYILKIMQNKIAYPCFFMLDGNKACAWDTEQHIIQNLEVGDYVFILDAEYGIVGAGTVTSEPNFSSLGTICYVDEDENEHINDYEETYVNISYDIKMKDHYDYIEEVDTLMSILDLKDYLLKLKDLSSDDRPENITVREFIQRKRRIMEIEALISSTESSILSIGKYLGESLKKILIENS